MKKKTSENENRFHDSEDVFYAYILSTFYLMLTIYNLSLCK